MEFSGKLYFKGNLPAALRAALTDTFDVNDTGDIMELYAYNPDGIDCIDELPLVIEELEPYTSGGYVAATSDDGAMFRYIFEDGFWTRYIRA